MQKEKPIYLKDFVRKTLLETEGRDYNEAEELRKVQEKIMKDSGSLSLVQEQENIKKDLLGVSKAIEEEEDDVSVLKMLNIHFPGLFCH